VIFDLTHIIPFLKRHGVDPATGEKMAPKDLTRLHFQRNGDGEYHCPITLKVFNEHSHIVAIGTTGNVFSYEAVKEFNLKPRFLHDLVSDTPFTRADIITLQDPMNPEGNNLSRLHHLKVGLTLRTSQTGALPAIVSTAALGALPTAVVCNHAASGGIASAANARFLPLVVK